MARRSSGGVIFIAIAMTGNTTGRSKTVAAFSAGLTVAVSISVTLVSENLDE